MPPVRPSQFVASLLLLLSPALLRGQNVATAITG